MKYILYMILLIFVTAPCKAQRVNLALNLTNGNTYYLNGTSNSSVSQSINGEEHKINTVLHYKLGFKVLSILDSVYNMEVRYQSLDMRIKIGDKIVEMDSKKNDKQDISSTIIGAMINRPFIITMVKTGKIKSINNVEKMITGVFDNFPQVDPVKKEQIKAQFLQYFGGSAFKGNLETSTAIYPDNKVIKADKWVVNNKLESIVKSNFHTVYQLTGVSGQYYQIRGNGTFISDNNAKTTQINGMPVKYNLKGTTTSNLKTDKTTGWISEVRLKQTMRGNFEILDNPKVPGGITVPMTVYTETNTTDK